jgi:hypothetical protein
MKKSTFKKSIMLVYLLDIGREALVKKECRVIGWVFCHLSGAIRDPLFSYLLHRRSS